MSAAEASPSGLPPRKRKRGGAGWKSNTVTYPEADPKVASAIGAAPSPTSFENVTELQYEEQESIIEDLDVSQFCQEWRKWPRMGRSVHGAHLIPMKCPLPDQFDEVSDEHKFTPSMAVRGLRSKGIPVGMVVALVHCQAKSYLTAWSEVSSNWASSGDGESLGVTICTLRICDPQKNLQSKQHSRFQLIPSEDEIKAFCHLVSNYLSRNPENYVAVHCCSGFNLTGFMIASYLIEMCNFSVDAAIQSFFKSRPPGIYKSVWLQALLVRYDDRNFSESISIAKQLLKGSSPSWDRPIYRGPLLTQDLNFDDLGEVRHVTASDETERLQSVFANLSDGISPDPFETISPRPLVELVQIGKIEAVTWRTKSPLLFLLLDGSRCYLVHKNNFFCLPQEVCFGHRKDPKKYITNTLLLGEYVIDKSEEGRVKTPRFLITDLISFHGQSQMSLYNLSNRLECARHEIVDPARSSAIPLRLRIKSMSKLSQAGNILTNILPSLPHESDGLFFVTSTGFRRSRPDSTLDVARFMEWAESVSAIKRAELLSSIQSISK